MMRQIAWQSMKSRLLVLFAGGLLLTFGFLQYDDIPMDILPEFSRPYVEVQTEALGLSAQEVEALITTPLEADMLNGTSWVDEIRSVSLPGLSSIVMVFEDGTNVMRARQMVQERLTQTFALPSVSKAPTMLNPVSSARRCMEIGLTSKNLSLIDMSVLARWTIVPRLKGVHGVANVSIWGQRKRQLQIQVNPENLRNQDVNLMQVVKSAGNALWASPLTFLEASTPGTGGWVDTPNQRLGVRHLLPISTPADLAKVSIDGTVGMRLGDVATVVEDHQPLIGDAIINDEPALMLVVERFPWANTMDVTEEVEKALVALKPALTGLTMDPTLFRPATYIDEAVDNLSAILVISVILAVVAMLAFFFNWRTVLISAAAGLISVAAAAAVFYLTGASLNYMILAGLMIALVAIIDDAVVDVDHIAKRSRQSTDRSKARRIVDALMDMRRAAAYATVVMALAVAPVLFMDGIAGAMAKPVVASYVLALVLSVATALTVTPVLCLLLLPKKAVSESKESPILATLERIYDRFGKSLLKAPKPAFAAVCALALAGLICLPMIQQESLLPVFKETDLVVRWDASAGASHTAMSRITRLATRELRAIPGVNNVSAHVGRAVMSDKWTTMNSGELRVSINPDLDYDTTLTSVKQVVAGYPGLTHEVLTNQQAKFQDELARSGDSLVVRVYGEDMGILHEKARDVQQILAKVDGIKSAKAQYPEQRPTLEIEVDLDQARQYGIKPGDVRRAATSLVSGIEVGSLFEEQKVFDVVVYGSSNTRHSLSSLQTLLIDRPGGGHVRLQDVADVRIVPAVNVIKRDAVARYIDVTAELGGRSLSAVSAAIQKEIQQMGFPLEYRAELLGDFADREASRERVIAFIITAAIGIFLLFQAYFKSWRLAAVVFLTLPMAVTGGIAAAFLSNGGTTVSLGSVIGLVAVMGIAVRFALALIGRYRDLERGDAGLDRMALVLAATRERLGPILTTTITAALVFLPLALSPTVAGLEILRPMAIVILGGLVTAALLALVGIPAMLILFGEAHEQELDFTPEAAAA